MSKSAGSGSAGVIEIMDTPEANLKKIKSAVTDAGREVKYDVAEKPGISNLLTIHSALSGKSSQISKMNLMARAMETLNLQLLK